MNIFVNQGCVFSNIGTSWLVLKSHNARTMPGKLPVRRGLTVKAEVKYVSADEAKELIAVEGYTILDVRDKTQFDRAHIKSCYHVPLFVENKDNDPGMAIPLELFCHTLFPLYDYIFSSFPAGTIIKRTLHNNFSGLFFGLPFTKLNTDFVQSVKSQLSPESKILVVCQEGLRLVYAILFALSV